MTAQELPLPRGSILLHIGPHKTGTSSVQSAFHLARPELRRRGVHYAGPDRHPVIAVQAAIEHVRPGDRRRRTRRWQSLLREIEEHRSDLVMVSSEWFADAKPEAIRRIVEELGRERVHVVVTARSLVRILPSQWQQYVAAGSVLAYEPWLRSIFGPADAIATPSFWQRHRHDALVRRWQAEVSPKRVTVVVVDEIDRRAVLRAFEALTGLEDGTLVPEADRANRSLTAPEAAVLLAVNARLADLIREPNLRLNIGLYGVAAALRLREPEAREPRIQTPAWAVAQASEIAAEIVRGLETANPGVIGDLAALAGTASAGSDTGSRARTAAGDAAGDEVAPDWPGIVATAAMGALIATGLAREARGARQRLEDLSGERLRRVAWQRTRNAVANRARALQRRPSTARATSGRQWAGAPAPSADVTAALGRIREAIRAEGLPQTLYDSLMRDGVQQALEEYPAQRPGAPSWPEIGAAIVAGTVTAAGLGGEARRLPPPRAGIETIEVARVSTPGVAVEVARRAAASILAARRGRGGGAG